MWDGSRIIATLLAAVVAGRSESGWAILPASAGATPSSSEAAVSASPSPRDSNDQSARIGEDNRMRSCDFAWAK